MKLDDVTPDDSLRQTVRQHLSVAGLSEVAAYLTVDEERTRRTFVATDVGLYVATENTSGDAAGFVEGVLTPWSEVTGARLVMSGYRNEFTSVVAKIATPLFDVRASSEQRRVRLIEFIEACMQRQRRWLPESVELPEASGPTT